MRLTVAVAFHDNVVLLLEWMRLLKTLQYDPAEVIFVFVDTKSTDETFLFTWELLKRHEDRPYVRFEVSPGSFADRNDLTM